MLFANQTWFYPAAIPVDMSIGLKHLDSEWGWCDPVIEMDENGGESVIHRQVAWN